MRGSTAADGAELCKLDAGRAEGRVDKELMGLRWRGKERERLKGTVVVSKFFVLRPLELHFEEVEVEVCNSPFSKRSLFSPNK